MYDVIIVGGGPAGLASAIYSSRFKLKTLVITKDMGGQTLIVSTLGNYPGFISTSGTELMQRFEEHALKSGAKIVCDEVVEVKEAEVGFSVGTHISDYKTKTVILALGNTPKDLEVPGERRLFGKGVFYGLVRDRLLFANKAVMVVGWRDLAMSIALSYSDTAYKVYMSYKTGNLLGDDKLKEMIKVKENVELIPSSQVMEIKGEERVESVVLQDLWKNEKKEVKIDGVFVALDYVEKTDFLKGLVEFNAVGKIVVDKGCSTSRSGVFAAGGITDNPSKQIAISAGEGAMAAISALKYIQRRYGP